MYLVAVTVGDGMDSGSATFRVNVLVTPIAQGPQAFLAPGSAPAPPAPPIPSPTLPVLPVLALFNPNELLPDLTTVAVGLPVQPTGQGGPTSGPPGVFQVGDRVSQGFQLRDRRADSRHHPAGPGPGGRP